MRMKAVYRRPFKSILFAPFQRRNIVTLLNILHNYKNPLSALCRYLSHRGEYPLEISLHDQHGELKINVLSPEDELTIIEIFCSLDYPAGIQDRVIVDIGSNRGFSALYFYGTLQIHSFIYSNPIPKMWKYLSGI
jgi:hypothetical protein